MSINTPTSIPGVETITATPQLAAGAEVVGGTRAALGGLANQVGQTALAGGAESIASTAFGLAGGLLTGAIIWKGIKVMAHAAAPSLFQG